MFKRVDGAFIFRVNGLVPRHYLVTEAQNQLLRCARLAIDNTGQAPEGHIVNFGHRRRRCLKPLDAGEREQTARR
jgi:hypothetical protein